MFFTIFELTRVNNVSRRAGLGTGARNPQTGPANRRPYLWLWAPPRSDVDIQGLLEERPDAADRTGQYREPYA